ncbi:hypothetical protein WG66_006324, partial [Moniliophthora roreri]
MSAVCSGLRRSTATSAKINPVSSSRSAVALTRHTLLLHRASPHVPRNPYRGCKDIDGEQPFKCKAFRKGQANRGSQWEVVQCVWIWS